MSSVPPLQKRGRPAGSKNTTPAHESLLTDEQRTLYESVANALQAGVVYDVELSMRLEGKPPAKFKQFSVVDPLALVFLSSSMGAQSIRLNTLSGQLTTAQLSTDQKNIEKELARDARAAKKEEAKLADINILETQNEFDEEDSKSKSSESDSSEPESDSSHTTLGSDAEEEQTVADPAVNAPVAKSSGGFLGLLGFGSHTEPTPVAAPVQSAKPLKPSKVSFKRSSKTEKRKKKSKKDRKEKKKSSRR